MNRAFSASALALMVTLALVQAVPSTEATSPQACFTSPNVVGVGQQFTVDASCSTNTAHVPAGIEYRWNFNFPSGPWVGPFPGPTHTHSYSAGGTYTIRLEVRDLITNDVSTSSRTILVGPANYAPAWGGITIYHDGTLLTFQSSFAFSGWICTPSVIPHPSMQCVAPAPPPGFVGWQCPGLALSAGAWNLGSSVNGGLDCTETSSAVTSTTTGDLFGPTAWASMSTPLVNDIVSITCHARPVTGQLAPQPPYFVACGDP